MNVKQLKEALGVLPEDMEVVLEMYECGTYSYPILTHFGITEQGEVALFSEMDAPQEGDVVPV